jgi:hypothetical protein
VKGISKFPMKKQLNRKKPEEIVAILARKHGCTPRNVQLVISGEVTNEKILTEYLWYKQENNQLLKKVKELVPFE